MIRTASELAEFLSVVKVGGALPITFSVVEHLTRDLAPDMRMRMVAPDVRGGALINVFRDATPPLPMEDADLARWLRMQVHHLYRHEADEQIRVAGFRVFEPTGEH